ncbi:MAG: hypothetical protein DMG60_10985 [Acidobacteria bacterium]|nr:MAG: hypothetical protein DMG60_10985 [Acidobacteriota bacterium]
MPSRQSMRQAIHSALLLCSLCSLLTAQSATDKGTKSATSATPTFRANSRLVQIDVIVLDGNGHPIQGLRQSDFKVIEDGKLQQVSSFDAHETKLTAAVQEPFHLPPHQYTNVPVDEPRGPLAVVLFDTLNTPALDQAAARHHLLEFLRALPPGQTTALFTLGTRMRMIQTFTGQSDVLVAAARRLLAGSSPLLTTETEHQRNEDDLIYRERMTAPSITGPGSGAAAQPPLDSDLLAGTTARLRDALTEQERFQITQRVGITLKSLAELAAMLQGYPGRKNLLWLSGAFPFSFGPNPFIRSEERDRGNFDIAVRQTTSLLSAAQVAVYPIDATGLRTHGIDLANTGDSMTGFDSSTGASRLNAGFARQMVDESDAQATMDEIAEQTGGKAYYGTNGLKTAMQRSLDQTSAYYTIAYAPHNQDWNGKFRHISVKTERAGVTLQYRRGYYALPEPVHSPQDSTARLVAALRPDIPDSTALNLKAQVLPPDADHRSVRITYLVNPQQITFTDAAEGRKHAFVDLLAVVWDQNGRDVGHSADTIDATFSQKEYLSILRAGLQASQEIAVKPSAYRVRLGVVDRLSQQVGTIDVLLAQPQTRK